MRVIVVVEARLSRTPDGVVWTSDGPAYPFFARYLSVFDAVRVVARVKDVPDDTDGDVRRVAGPQVAVWPVPYYLGPGQYLMRRRAVRRAVCAAADGTDAVIIRAPSTIALPLAVRRARLGLPFALEVMGDPHDLFAPGAVHHPLRPLLRRWSTNWLRDQCRTAVAVSYVTEGHLQARYPAGADAVTTNYSSVDLPAEAYVPLSRTADRPPTRLLVSVGSLEYLYKGVDTLIRALHLLRRDGDPRRLVHLGDGRARPGLERLAAELGVGDQVVFAGTLGAGASVRRHLDAADLFVLPSRTEGLPKALLEAMARALPAIGSTAGGIPELLPAEDLVAPGDPAALADAIARMTGDPARMTVASARNLARARDFSAEALTSRRDAFYQAVAVATRAGAVGSGPAPSRRGRIEMDSATARATGTNRWSRK